MVKHEKKYILFTLNQEGGGLTHFLNNFKENWKPLGILRNSQFSSVQFSRLVMCNSLRPHGLQHARLLCPSPTREAYSNSVMPSNHLILCHPLLLLPSIFPSIRVFSSQFFTSGGQSIGVSASASVLPMNIQD